MNIVAQRYIPYNKIKIHARSSFSLAVFVVDIIMLKFIHAIIFIYVCIYQQHASTATDQNEQSKCYLNVQTEEYLKYICTKRLTNIGPIIDQLIKVSNQAEMPQRMLNSSIFIPEPRNI